MLNLNVVLFEPEIPQNTGNIARTCAAVGAKLHLIKPLGFSLEDKYLKRAGMDYWKKVDVFCYPNAVSFFKDHAGGDCVFITKKAEKTYESINVNGNLFLVFGKETSGVPEDILEKFPDRCFRIPMRRDIRSLNLATAVAVVIYDVLRKKGFPGLIPGGRTG